MKQRGIPGVMEKRNISVSRPVPEGVELHIRCQMKGYSRVFLHVSVDFENKLPRLNKWAIISNKTILFEIP